MPYTYADIPSLHTLKLDKSDCDQYYRLIALIDTNYLDTYITAAVVHDIDLPITRPRQYVRPHAHFTAVTACFSKLRHAANMPFAC